jgi:hypothetical protein
MVRATRQRQRKQSRSVGKAASARATTHPAKHKRSVGARARRAKPAGRREAGSIGEAAARVVKSGARLVGHTSQRVIAQAASVASAKVHNALRSVLHSGVDRDSKS